MLLKSLFSTLLIFAVTGVIGAQSPADSCQPAKIAFYVEVALGAKNGVTRLYQAEERAADPGFVPNRTTIPTDEDKANYERRRKVLVEPIVNELRSSLSEIALSNRFTLFEGVALDEPSSYWHWTVGSILPCN